MTVEKYKDFYTGNELLEKKLKEMGLTPAQIRSKVVPAMLCIFADENNALDAHKMFVAMMENLKEGLDYVRTRSEFIEKRERELREQMRRVEKEKSDIELTWANLMECETPEMRDRFRLAEYYRTYASQANVYHTTEFNKGLALILSGNKGDEE